MVCQLPLDIGTDSAAAIQPFAQDQWLQVRAGAEATGLKKVAYTAGGNAFWVDPFMCLVPGIPINRSSISKLQQQVFASPQQAAENRRALHVGILDGEEVLDMRGKLRLISPDEEFFALIFELDKVIASDPGEAVLAQWLSLIRSWTFVFELLPSLDACYWRCINLREHVGTSFDVFYRSCIQRAYEVIQFKLEQERKDPGTKLSASAVFQAWTANVQFSTLATGDKAFKQSFVDACLTVYNRMLSIPEVEALILKGEERNGKDNVWNSIYQLEEV